MERAGRMEGFLAAAGIWAVSNACIGATPAAYAADVMPQNVSGLGLGIYRCAGDMGAPPPPAHSHTHNPSPLSSFVVAISLPPSRPSCDTCTLPLCGVAFNASNALYARQHFPDSNSLDCSSGFPVVKGLPKICKASQQEGERGGGAVEPNAQNPFFSKPAITSLLFWPIAAICLSVRTWLETCL